jgi:hypothetical protein
MATRRLYTLTQERMLKILSDGLPHTKQELHSCLYDDQGPVNNVQMHISNLRDRIQRNGFDIVCCRNNGDSWYRMVRHLASAYDGRK